MPLSASRKGRSRSLPQFQFEARIDQNAPRPIGIVLGDQEAPRQEAERSFEYAHVLIGDEASDAGVLHQAFGKGKKDGIIGADQFFHPALFSCLKAAGGAIRLLPPEAPLSIVEPATKQESGRWA
jgi:hypothetical protein